ncbi:lytic transglycosylase domain-containing protein [Kiloniella sp.]|uniref:lytic transglycosylase domain-containing protein n=1 Tax=Kiloniella sp. TaxID=1938587 RepID=UPI003B029BCF
MICDAKRQNNACSTISFYKVGLSVKKFSKNSFRMANSYFVIAYRWHEGHWADRLCVMKLLMRRLRKINLPKTFLVIGIISFFHNAPLKLNFVTFINTANAAVSSGTQDFAKDRTLFKSVRQHVIQKQYSRALSQAKKINDSLLKEIGLWVVLSSNVGVGDYDQLGRFIADPTNWPRQSVLRRSAEKKLPANMSASETFEWFEEQKPTSLEGLIRYVFALEQSGRSNHAEESIREFWRFNYLGKTDEKKFLKKYSKIVQNDDHIKRLDILIWNKHFVAANRQLPRVSKEYQALGNARIALLKRKGNVDGLLRKVPANLQKDPGLIFARAKWRLKANRNQDAIDLLDPPLKDPVEPDKWWSLKHWAARKLLVNNEFEKAYRISSSHGLTQGVGFAEGEWLTGWIALRKLGMPRRAYTHFHQLYNGVKSPISKARAAYWSGRAAKEIGHDDWAKRWFTIAAAHKTTFYGQQAGYELGDRPAINNSDALNVTNEQKLSFNDKKIVRSILLLNKLGEDKLVTIYLTRLRLDSKTKEDHILAANLALEIGQPNIALRTAKSARQKGILLPDLLYPDLSFSPPNGANTEPALILALIRQESEFNHKAISHAGARGLMQLMPATAKSVAKKEKVKYKKQNLTNDPSYNVRLGTAYLSELIRSFKGSYVMALAGYNAGPHRVKKWIKDYGDPRDPSVDVIDWIEQIPFNETRNYVQRILESHLIYRDKLKQSTPTTTIVGQLPYSLWGHPNSGS